MSIDADIIAAAVLQQYDKLPQKRKPLVRDNGVHEWVPLSGIVAEQDGVVTCISLATGMKCLPASKLPEAQGNGIHDWHAEVLAIRMFNHFLLAECEKMLKGKYESEFLERRSPPEPGREPELPHGQPFALRDNVSLHMYCSEAPCGDASMELTMAAQGDASPWEISSNLQDGSSTPGTEPSLPGRAYFSRLGVVRRKPARGDAPPTMSKSCSDKLALKQCTSLLSSLTSLYVSPKNAYIQSLILPISQYSSVACERSFSAQGRMNGVSNKQWPGGYSFSPFQIQTTSIEFGFSKRSVQARTQNIAASNLAAAWTCGTLDEGLVGGVLQGRKPFDMRGASLASRRKMWSLALDIANLLEEEALGQQRLLLSPTYLEVKQGEPLAARRNVKDDVRAESLSGWAANSGDEGFRLGQPT